MKITTDLEKTLRKFEWHSFDNTAELCCMIDNIINDHIIKGNNNSLYIELLLQQPENDFDKITAWLRKKHTTAKNNISHFKKKLDNQEMFYLEDLRRENWSKKREYYWHCLRENKLGGHTLEGKEIDPS